MKKRLKYWWNSICASWLYNTDSKMLDDSLLLAYAIIRLVLMTAIILCNQILASDPTMTVDCTWC